MQLLTTARLKQFWRANNYMATQKVGPTGPISQIPDGRNLLFSVVWHAVPHISVLLVFKTVVCARACHGAQTLQTLSPGCIPSRCQQTFLYHAKNKIIKAPALGITTSRCQQGRATRGEDQYAWAVRQLQHHQPRSSARAPAVGAQVESGGRCCCHAVC